MPVLDGYDVAGTYQPGFPWQWSYDQGHRLAAFKATQGTGFRDPWFTRNRNDTEAIGFRYRGMYHWVSPGVDLARQLAFFESVVGDLRPGEFIQLDQEESPLSLDECVRSCELWSQRYPGRIAHYGGAFFGTFGHGHVRLRPWPWWLAWYGRSSLPIVQVQPVIWQWGGSPVPGMHADVDANQIILTSTLEGLAGYQTVNPPPQRGDIMAYTAIGSACHRWPATHPTWPGRMQHYRAVCNTDGTVTVLGMNGASIGHPTGDPAFGNSVYTIPHQTTEFLGLVGLVPDHGGCAATFGQGIWIDITP